MVSVWQIVLACAVSAAVAGFVATLVMPIVVRVAHLVRALDYPGERKVHTMPVPRLGGVAIALGVVFGAGSVWLVKVSDWGSHVDRGDLAAVILAAGLVFLAGLVEDVAGLRILQRLAIEGLAAAIVVGVNWYFDVLAVPGLGTVHLGTVGAILTWVWIIGVTNAVNLLDGLDGLAAGVTGIIAVNFLMFAVVLGNVFTAVLMAAVAGACGGFLRHNWTPARVFMGDSGSLLLGFILAVMSVHSSLKTPAAVALLVPVLALGVPVFDTLLVMLVRFLDRPKSRLGERVMRMFVADNNHLHHVLLRLGGDGRKVVGWIFALTLAFCALAMTVAFVHDTTLGVTVVAVEFVVVAAVRWLRLPQVARSVATGKREGWHAAVASDAVAKAPASARPAARKRAAPRKSREVGTETPE